MYTFIDILLYKEGVSFLVLKPAKAVTLSTVATGRFLETLTLEAYIAKISDDLVSADHDDSGSNGSLPMLSDHYSRSQP